MGRPRKRDRHLPPSVYPSNGAYFHVVGGKWHRLGRDLPTALAEYARRIGAFKQGGMPALIERYMASLPKRVEAKSLSQSSVDQYRSVAKKLTHIFAEYSPEQVRMKDVAGMMLHYSDMPSTGNQCRAVLMEVFNFALQHQIVDTNPVVGVKRLKETPRTRLLSNEEIALIKSAASPRLQAVMDVLYLTAQRVGDVVSIKPEHMREEGLYFLQDKGETRLVVRWHPGLRAAVARLLVVRGRGLNYDMVERDWLKATRRVGVKDAHIHDIRAKALTDAKAQGLDPTALAGHATEAQTETYLRDRVVPVVNGPRVLGT